MAKIAVLKVYGDIGEPMPDLFFTGEDTVSAKQVSEFLDANKDAESIEVRINSRGGDVQEGWAIYDLLTTSGKKITTVGEGKVYSIATVVFLAGSERKMLKNADGLIHNPYIPPYTLADKYESNDLLKIAEGLVQEEEKILDFYAAQTGTDRAKLAEYMKEETKLSAEDMVSLGFATSVIEPVKAYAYLKPKNIMSKQFTEAEKVSFMQRFDAVMQGDFAKAFSRISAKNQELTDTSGNKLTLEKEAGAPAVGDVASPDGTYVMENGDTITVKDGKVESIMPSAAPEDELAKAKAEIEKLKGELAAASAKATDAEGKLAAVNAKVAEAETAKASYVAQETKAKALVAELEALKNEWKPAARSQNTGSTTAKKVGEVDLDRVAEIIKNQKK